MPRKKKKPLLSELIKFINIRKKKKGKLSHQQPTKKKSSEKEEEDGANKNAFGAIKSHFNIHQ